MPGWSEIIGHRDIIGYMKQAVREGSPSHAYLLGGARGVGKGMIAEAFALALSCTEPHDGEPCGLCHGCIQALSGNHPDIIHVTHEKPNLISVQEVREQIVDDIAVKPYSGRYKIYIIEDADKMNPQAQNALLKTLEEPPAYGVLILTSTAPDTLLQTIRSRCVSLSLRGLTNATIRDHLMKTLQVDASEAELCTAFAQGSLGQAMLLAQSEDFAELRKEMLDLLENITDLGRGELLEELKKLAQRKADLSEPLELMEAWYRDVLLYKATEDKGRLIFQDAGDAISHQARSHTYEGLEKILKCIHETRSRLNANVSTELALDLLLVNLKESR